MYTEYNDERVKQLMNLSKKDFPHVAEYMLCLMCVDYHCRDEVGMDFTEIEELIKRFEKNLNEYIMSKYSKSKQSYSLTLHDIHDTKYYLLRDVLFVITDQGTTNYTSVPTKTIPATAGVGMAATCTLTAGKVRSVTLLNKAYGYAGATSLALAFSGGEGAEAFPSSGRIAKVARTNYSYEN